MKPLAVLSVASEVFPLVKTGGLADVVGALPGALAAEGVDVRTLVPGYPAVLAALPDAEVVLDLPQFHGGRAHLRRRARGAASTCSRSTRRTSSRDRATRTSGADGRDWPDNALRFAALAAAAADLGRGRVPALVPDIVHAHDWQAGLAPAYLHYGDRRRTRARS